MTVIYIVYRLWVGERWSWRAKAANWDSRSFGLTFLDNFEARRISNFTIFFIGVNFINFILENVTTFCKLYYYARFKDPK